MLSNISLADVMENEHAFKKRVEAGKDFGERFKNGCVMENKNASDFLT